MRTKGRRPGLRQGRSIGRLKLGTAELEISRAALIHPDATAVKTPAPIQIARGLRQLARQAHTATGVTRTEIVPAIDGLTTQAAGNAARPLLRRLDKALRRVALIRHPALALIATAEQPTARHRQRQHGHHEPVPGARTRGQDTLDHHTDLISHRYARDLAGGD